MRAAALVRYDFVFDPTPLFLLDLTDGRAGLQGAVAVAFQAGVNQ